jgi:REP element-mobilizing transposase RayT
MPRRVVPFLPDQYYHFYNRGNNRQAVFFERENYLFFLRRFKRFVVGYVDVIAYCLMPTHYHILVRVKQILRQISEGKTSEVLETSEVSTSKQVSLAMQKFGISYVKAINKRFGRVGALFQGQFQGKPVTSYEHLLNLCVYIHANPVKDGLVSLPENWEYSNYLEWMGLREGMLVNHGFIAENFGTSEEYKQKVMDYIETRYLPDDFRKYIQDVER